MILTCQKWFSCVVLYKVHSSTKYKVWGKSKGKTIRSRFTEGAFQPWPSTMLFIIQVHDRITSSGLCVCSDGETQMDYLTDTLFQATLIDLGVLKLYCEQWSDIFGQTLFKGSEEDLLPPYDPLMVPTLVRVDHTGRGVIILKKRYQGETQGNLYVGHSYTQKICIDTWKRKDCDCFSLRRYGRTQEL